MEPIATFAAQNSTDSITLWLGLLALVGGTIGCIVILRQAGTRDTYNRRMLGAMLCFFLALLGLGTAVFSYLSMHKMSDVVLYADRLETGYGTVALTDIGQIKIEKAGRASLVEPGRFRNETKLLIIGERSGKAHVLPEEVYDIQGILRELRALRPKQ